MPRSRARRARRSGTNLHQALEHRLGPRPLGLADRDDWDTTAARALKSPGLPKSLELEPDAPDATPTREWMLPEPPELPAPEPDVGFDFDL